MNAEEPTEHPVSTTEPQPGDSTGVKGPESQERPRHRGGRRGRFRRGGRGGRDHRPERERPDRPEGEARSEGGPAPTDEGRKPVSSNLRRAIDQVLHVRAELRRVLDEMQEVLRTLDQAEREKAASEDEIEMLRESLRGLQPERGYPRQRGGPPPRPAPVPAAVQDEPEPAVEADEEEDEPEEEA